MKNNKSENMKYETYQGWKMQETFFRKSINLPLLKVFKCKNGFCILNLYQKSKNC